MATENKRFLDKRTSHYAVFEENQVLTAEHLNSVVEWLDDESRLTRVALLGVGIICGLVPRDLEGKAVELVRGAGITTDGDLAWVGEAQRFVAVKPFVPTVSTGPASTRLVADGESCFELLTEARAGDAGAQSIEAFGGSAELDKYVAVLVIETTQHDRDACTATGCDNLGRHITFDQRLVLVSHASADALLAREALETAPEFEPISIPRAQFAAGLQEGDKLRKAYLAACDAMRTALGNPNETGLVHRLRAHPTLADALTETEISDSESWSKLEAANCRSLQLSQYHYAFLQDVVTTVNEIIGELDDVDAGCCPSPTAFPKHLVLGGFTPESSERRTAFQPSTALRGNTNRRARARFLMRRLYLQLKHFQGEPSSSGIVITSSRSAVHELGERAVPFYYAASHALAQGWSPRLKRAGAKLVPGYRAADGMGTTARQGVPLPTVGVDFFRIEGHLGLPVAKATRDIEALVAAHNVPIQVRAVLLGTEGKVVPTRPKRWTDLHRFHSLLRQDLRHQVDQSDAFSQELSTEFEQRRDSLFRSQPDPGNDNAIPRQAELLVQVDELKSAARTLRGGLGEKRAAVAALLKTAVGRAGDIKRTVGVVTKTDFPSPLDKLIVSPHLEWVEWVGELIDDKDQRRETRERLSEFVKENPGIDHLGGVPCGGTFVLAYDKDGLAVADFGLPYWVADLEEVEPAPEQEKQLTPRVTIPDALRRPPMRFEPVRTRHFADEAVKAFAEYDKRIAGRFEKILPFLGGAGGGDGGPAGGGAGGGGGGFGGGIRGLPGNIAAEVVQPIDPRELSGMVGGRHFVRTSAVATSDPIGVNRAIETANNATVEIAVLEKRKELVESDEAKAAIDARIAEVAKDRDVAVETIATKVAENPGFAAGPSVDAAASSIARALDQAKAQENNDARSAAIEGRLAGKPGREALLSRVREFRSGPR